MAKGAVEVAAPVGAPDRLEERIRQLELALATRTLDAVSLLSERSALERRLQTLQAGGADVRAERSRLDTIDNMLRSAARRLASGGKAWQEARTAQQPPAEHWWWWLDEVVQEERRRAARRVVVMVIVAVVVGTGITWALNRFGASPEQREAASQAALGDQLLTQGEFAAAIDAYRASLATVEAQPEVWVSLTVLYDLTRQSEQAERALQRAGELVQGEAELQAALARSYELAGDCEAALDHAEAAVLAKPDDPQGYLVRGSAQECLGDWQTALVDYDRASSMALEQSQDALYVLARTRYGMLLQMRGAGGSPAGQP
ncbi:MAG: tetratricopeptide repeat protein [Anaerolineae bacterium]|jgi:tetratricopeptide (TPR) repeat protein|nr:hypothetical protein [Chloroflexota bacterium]